MTLSLPTKGTYFFASSLVLGLVLAGNLDELFRRDKVTEAEPVAVEEPVVRNLPEAEMLKPEPEPEPEPVPEQQAEPQDLPPPLAQKKPVESETEEKPPAEPVAEEPDESRSAELEIARQLPKKEAEEFKERVKEGKRLNEQENIRLGFSAATDSKIIEKLLVKGQIQFALTNGSANYWLFNGTWSKPGEPEFRQKKYLNQQGFSSRAMNFNPLQAAKFKRRATLEKLYGNVSSWGVVILVKQELNYMVLSAQSRVARKKKIPFEDVQSTSGRFQFLKGLPFNYEIDEIIFIERNDKKTALAGKAPLKKTEIQ